MNIDIHINTRTFPKGNAAFRRHLNRLFFRIEESISDKVINDQAFAVGMSLLKDDGEIICSIELSK